MEKNTRMDLQVYSAIGMLLAGVGLSTAGFCVAPLGEISDSVLWFFAQCLIYAGSALGITVFVQNKFSELEKQMRSEIGTKSSKSKSGKEAVNG